MPPRKGLWLKIAKKGSGIETVTYAEALDVALCYGWIDGQKDAVDDRWRLQRFTPPGAPEQVVEDQPRPGDRADRGGADAPRRALGVEGARADGRWEAAYDSPSRATSPRTWPSMPTPTPGVLRHAGPHQPLRHPVPHPRRQRACDPGSEHQDVRCHARSGREALSLTPRSPAVRTGQAPAGAAAPRRRRWRRDG